MTKTTQHLTRVAATAAATLAVTVAAAVAQAPAGETHPGGWSRERSAGFVSPAGDLCSFRLRSVTRFDKVFGRTTATFANGDPRRQEFSGPLVVRLVNARTGAAVTRDLSGRAVVTYRRDGSFRFASWGPVAVGFHPGDGLARGYYVLDGHHVVRFAADGTRTVVVDGGTEENTCRALRG